MRTASHPTGTTAPFSPLVSLRRHISSSVSSSSGRQLPKGANCRHDASRRLSQTVTAERPLQSAAASATSAVLDGATPAWQQSKSSQSQGDMTVKLPLWKQQSAAGPLQEEELWAEVRREAQGDADAEPVLASSLHTNILAHSSLGKAMAHLLAIKMSSRTLLGTQLMRLIRDAYADEPAILQAAIADVQAARERDPACEQFTQCLLHFKGFQAVQCYRVGHWLWMQGRHALAIALQSRVSEVMQVDIHPAARIGQGVLMDHATGVVIGETAVIGDNVSMLHHVTLGGSGTGEGVRHPTIGDGVLLGAGVSVLGPITVGACTKIGAGSVVVQSLPENCVAVGVPARVIKQKMAREPSIDMDQCKDYVLDYMI